MTNIDYTEIDELCRDSIKYLNEILNIPTKFCCQGGPHGKSRRYTRAYISFPVTLQSEKFCMDFCKHMQFHTVNIGSEMSYSGVKIPMVVIRFTPAVKVDSSKDTDEAAIKRVKLMWNKVFEFINSYNK